MTVDRLAAALRSEGRSGRFRRGEALFVEGDRPERVFLLERGLVLLSFRGPEGREVVLDVFGPGEIIGELSVIDGDVRTASALALDEVQAVIAPARVFLRALEDAAALRELLSVVTARLRRADKARIELTTLNTLGRVAWRLVELVDRFGAQTDEGTEVALPLAQDQLASWCGASREATVRALATLRRLAVISTGRRRLLVRDEDALRRVALGHA